MNCWETLRAVGATTELETADVTAEKANGLGNQQPSSCPERVEKVQRLGHTAYGTCYGDEVRRVKGISIVLVHPKRPAPTR
ncbi:hypothetical protein M493_16257 [Geobacillus genomosp. 3]|uniref:Uncharacterized protein n=1 Tax=Geobacillus genomosp. 3 TaxID=1921421 RepID=V5LX30_GEOG3|nr:hypothetical protein M493_16257 [Geobacillus genomosp. 3]